MDEAPVKRRFRLGCLGWMVVAVAVLVLLAIGYVLWLRNDGDLRAVEAEMRTAGLPTNWKEVGLVPGSPERQGDWRRLLVLAEAVKSYQSSDLNPDSSSFWLGPKPGQAVPPEVIAYHAGIDPTALAEIDAILGRLGMEAVNTRTELGFADRIEGVTEIRELTKLYQERLAIVPPEKIAPLAGLMQRLAPIREPPTLIGELVSLGFSAMLTSALAVRLSDIPEADREPLATMCDQVDALLARQALLGARCAVFSTIDYSRRAVRASNAELGSSMFFLGSGNSDNPVMAWFENEAIRAGIRLGRAEVARFSIRRARELASTNDPLIWMKESILRETDAQRIATPAWSKFAKMMLPAFGMIDVRQVESRMILRLLAAELRHQPWPTDPRDPAGGPYRRFERDGKLIGAYSVGKNGVDEAGEGDDRCFNLYGVCKLPKP